MSAHAADLPGFETVYRRHVDLVVAGDLGAVMADMAPGSVPAVFEGVDVPRGGVSDARVMSVRLDGDRAIGEAEYRTPVGVIGLRSGWQHDGTTWKADSLANFAPDRVPGSAS